MPSAAKAKARRSRLSPIAPCAFVAISQTRLTPFCCNPSVMHLHTFKTSLTKVTPSDSRTQRRIALHEGEEALHTHNTIFIAVEEKIIHASQQPERSSQACSLPNAVLYRLYHRAQRCVQVQNLNWSPSWDDGTEHRNSKV